MFTDDRGGILDDLMVTRRGERSVRRRQRRLQGRQDIAHLRAAAVRPGTPSRNIDDRALLALQGPGGRAVHEPRSVARRRRARLHERRFEVTVGAPCLFCHPFGLYRRGRLRDFGPGHRRRGARPPAAGRGGGKADRPGSARFAAARGRALPLRPRHRHDDQPDRGRAGLDDLQAPARAGRLPRGGGDPGPAGPRHRAQARRGSSPKAAPPRAKARRSSIRPATASVP